MRAQVSSPGAAEKGQGLSPRGQADGSQLPGGQELQA